jgi:hypothetical protein
MAFCMDLARIQFGPIHLDKTNCLVLQCLADLAGSSAEVQQPAKITPDIEPTQHTSDNHADL